MNRILVTIPFDERHKAYIEEIGKGCTFTYAAPSEVTDAQLAQADILIGNVAASRLSAAKNLKWMQLNSAGADAYCREGVLADDVLLTCATGAYGLTVAEHMVAMTWMMCRKFDLYAANQPQKLWQSMGSVKSIWNSTTLVIGMGDIGCEYAQRMKALGSHVIGVRRTAGDVPPCADEVYTTEYLDALLPRADFVALALPGTAQTHHLMDERRLRLMKNDAYIINAGRGSAIDCDALDRVLREGNVIAGCALDVTDPEPLPPEHPLWTAPRAFITPHVAGSYFLQETLERIVRIAGENLGKYLAGDIAGMSSPVDRGTGYRKK